MKNIVIFEDGKSGRGSKAKLIKRGNKRVLIEFDMYDYELGIEKPVTEWFTVFKPTWGKKFNRTHNNKRKSATYYHKETNEFYSDREQTAEFQKEFREYRGKEYCDELFGEG